MKITCASCKAPYDVDERRLPSGGTKMRCPKCGTSFTVRPPAAPSAELPASKPGVALPHEKTRRATPLPRGLQTSDLPRKVEISVPPVLGRVELASIRKGFDPKQVSKLPAVKKPPPPPPSIRAKSPGFDPDLPALRDNADLPAPRASSPPFVSKNLRFDKASLLPSLDADLPALSIPAAQNQSEGPYVVDLPAPGKMPGKDGFAELPGLPQKVDLPARVASSTVRDLPTSKKAASEQSSESELSFDLELKAPSVAPGQESSKAVGKYDPNLPAASLGVDLPSPKSLAALPSPQNVQGLVRPRGDSGLPAPMPSMPVSEADESAGLEFQDLELGFSDPPASVSSGNRDFELQGTSGKPDAFGTGDIFGQDSVPSDVSALDLMTDLTSDGHSDTEADAFAELFGEQSSPAPAADNSQHVAPDAEFDIGAEADLGFEQDDASADLGFGEVDLGAPEVGDSMEFADIPQAAGGVEFDVAAGVPGVIDDFGGDEIDDTDERPSKLKRFMPVIIASGILLMLLGLGAGLGFTPYGYFGMYAIERFYPAAGTPAEAKQIVSQAEALVVQDTFANSKKALQILAKGRDRFGLNRLLLSKSLFHESYHQIRFGENAASTTRMTGILQRLRDRQFDAPAASLGVAASDAHKGKLDESLSKLAEARVELPNDPMVELLAGELALKSMKIEDAQRAFEAAAKNGGGSSAKWGLARISFFKAQDANAIKKTEAVLASSPLHVEARLAKARLLWKKLGQSSPEIEALANEGAGLKKVEGQVLAASKYQRGAAWSLLGLIYEQEGRIGEASLVFEKALAADAGRTEALLGAGRVLLADKRPGDALARFDSVINSKSSEDKEPLQITGDRNDPVVSAKLGAAQAMLELERAQSAKELMAALATELPEDPEVKLWLGKAEEALKNPDVAEKLYREAIKIAPHDFSGYLALSQLFFSMDKTEDAARILRNAEGKVADNAERRRMLGRAELSRGEIDAALKQFRSALELEPDNLPARFDLGMGLRHAGKLDEASSVLNEVEKKDPSFPGLAVEQGRIFEARGQWEAAVRNYRTALEKSPQDSNLLMRLGASQVEAGHTDAAAETLEKVREIRPNSAEVAFFMGRVAFDRKKLNVALEEFRKATALDSKQGEYFMYAGWAALEAGTNIGSALDFSNTAIKLDPSLGDAYWVRGKVMLRTGAVEDARRDFERVIKIKPSRYEVYADLGDAYDQLRKISQAIEAYEQAVSYDERKGQWWYRLGALMIESGRVKPGLDALERAVKAGSSETDAPDWLSEAHRLIAEALVLEHRRAEALEHYQHYLDLAPATAIDREEVEAIIKAYKNQEGSGS
ncbi:MAG: zinc-ribbon domain-containing protein [Myxococcales bacterium]|nr:MAG: zinc-ribbon domain-containing protein [Myxococcales bacterium]